MSNDVLIVGIPYEFWQVHEVNYDGGIPYAGRIIESFNTLKEAKKFVKNEKANLIQIEKHKK